MKWKHSGRELWLLEWTECKIHFLICLDSHFRPDWRRHKCFLDIVMVTLVILEISSVNTLISSFFLNVYLKFRTLHTEEEFQKNSFTWSGIRGPWADRLPVIPFDQTVLILG